MHPRRKKRFVVVTLIVVGLSISVGLMMYALSQNIDLFYTPSEVIDGKAGGQRPQVGERLRIGGMVVRGSVERDPHSLRIIFRLKDVGEQVTVQYTGILPDLFREGQGIVAQGVLVAPRTIKAYEVLAKHDETYTPPEIKEAMDKNHHLSRLAESVEGTE